MKKLIYLLSIVSTILTIGFTSCGDSDDDSSDNTTIDLVINSIYPADGTKDLLGDVAPTITFSGLIEAKSWVNLGATLNGEPLSGYKNGKQLILSNVNVEYNGVYTIIIPAGALVGYENEIKFTFYGKGKEAPTPSTTEKTTKLVNGNATAQRLYDYLWSIYGKQILSGTIANVSVNQVEAGMIKDITGKTPAMFTLDFIFSNLTADRSTWEQNSIYQDISVYKSHFEKNGIVSACWHLNVPSQQSYAAKNNVNDANAAWNAQNYFSAQNAIKEGTWEKEFFDFSLECVIEILKKYKEAGIPIIWRPWHEASGNATITGKNTDAWFWWGKDGAEAYKALWIYVFDKFKAEGLDNLIWVWTTQTGVDTGNNWYCDNDFEWYPGDSYVDIVARDSYDHTKTQQVVDEFDKIQAMFPGKMITLGENGNMAKISDVFNGGGTYSYFMPWYDYDVDNNQNGKTMANHQHANTEWWNDAAACDKVLFLEDLPNWQN